MIRGILTAPLRGAIARASGARRRSATLETLLHAACLDRCDELLNAALRTGVLVSGESGAEVRRELMSALAAYYASLLPGEDLGPPIGVARDIQIACAPEFFAALIDYALNSDKTQDGWRAARARLFSSVHGPAVRILVQHLERNQGA